MDDPPPQKRPRRNEALDSQDSGKLKNHKRKHQVFFNFIEWEMCLRSKKQVKIRCIWKLRFFFLFDQFYEIYALRFDQMPSKVNTINFCKCIELSQLRGNWKKSCINHFYSRAQICLHADFFEREKWIRRGNRKNSREQKISKAIGIAENFSTSCSDRHCPCVYILTKISQIAVSQMRIRNIYTVGEELKSIASKHTCLYGVK